MRRNYHTLGKDHTEELSEYLSRDGQLLLALVELLETGQIVVDQFIDIVDLSTIEVVLKILAQGVVGAKHQGKRRGKVGWHRSQTGVVSLSERKMQDDKQSTVLTNTKTQPKTIRKNSLFQTSYLLFIDFHTWQGRSNDTSTISR